nr:zinc finger, CCHC-type [Tanacetum cinerariifolium]
MTHEVVTSLVQNVVNKLFGIAKKEISYMMNCSKNIEDLKRENEKLTQMKGRVQQQITTTKYKGNRLLDGLEEWVANAESQISKAQEVIDKFEANAKKKCFNLGICINLGTFYRYDICDTQALESNSLLWKVITQFQVISGSHSWKSLKGWISEDGKEDALLAFQHECGVCTDYSYARGMSDNLTVDQVRRRAKWDNNDYVYRGLILNEAKYMAEDASSKKFFVSNFTNYKMTDSRPVLEQYNELLKMLRRFTQHKMNMDESIQVSCIIDKLPPLWKDFKHTLKHMKEELTLVELCIYLHIEESLGVQDNDKPKGNNVAGPLVVNMVKHNNSSRYNDNRGKRKHHDTKADPNKKPKVTCWKCGKPGHLKKDCKASNVGNKANSSGTKGSFDGSFNPLKGQNIAIVHVCKDRCWFRTYESLNDRSILYMGNKSIALVHGRGCVDLRFYVIEPNDFVAINSIIESRDAIFDENRFSSVPRPSQKSLEDETEYSGGLVVPKKVTHEIVQQSKLEEIGYMWNSSENVEDLKRENEKLTQMRGRVQQQITVANNKGDRLLDGMEEWVECVSMCAPFIVMVRRQMRGSVVVAAKEKGDRLKDGVEEWVVDIESHISEAKEVIEWGEENANKTRFNLGMCTDLGTLYHYGKKAITKSIEAENKQIIGIYTTGGVGKTTLAKEVDVMMKSLFAAIEFTTVSQTVDAKRIKRRLKRQCRVGFLWGKRWRVVGSNGNGREGAGSEEEGVV